MSQEISGSNPRTTPLFSVARSRGVTEACLPGILTLSGAVRCSACIPVARLLLWASRAASRASRSSAGSMMLPVGLYA